MRWALRVPTTTGPFGVVGASRTWIDADGDLVADCDFSNPLAHGNSGAVNGGGGPDFCGQLSNIRFGQRQCELEAFGNFEAFEGFLR